MLGTVVNTAAIIIGGLIGLMLKKGLPAKITSAVMQGLALCVIWIGISGAFEGKNMLITIIAMVVGIVVGELMDLDGKINRLGGLIQKKMHIAEGATSVAEGFATASMLFCVGAMAIIGAMQSGLAGDHQTLYTKSMLDFVSSIMFASTLGIGVLFSAGAVLVYQGILTLLAHWAAPYLTDAAVAEMTCVGSLLIIGIGLNMLGVTKIKIMNCLPAMFLPIVLSAFM